MSHNNINLINFNRNADISVKEIDLQILNLKNELIELNKLLNKYIQDISLPYTLFLLKFSTKCRTEIQTLTLSGRGLYPIYGTLAKSQQVGCFIYSIPFLNKLLIIYIKGVKINDLSGPRIIELLKKKSYFMKTKKITQNTIFS